MPSISIIATVLNEAESIDRLVESLLRQSQQPLEIVIVDGGSTDGTWERLQQHAASSPLLRAIRDESCNLKHSRGPIARGRNLAIAATHGAIIACCDAGCSYDPDWLVNLTRPLLERGAQYVLGGSRIEPSEATTWDLAAAPLMGVSMTSEGSRRSCTARSMAFSKTLWERAGKFPETTLLGEDTWFDFQARDLVEVAYAENAMALYRPRLSWGGAVGTIARYSAADGALGTRRSRFLKMLLRCLLQVLAVGTLPWRWWLLAIDAVLELYIAFERDRSVLRPSQWRGLVPRLVFSVSVPWITVYYYLRGTRSKAPVLNPQNLSGR